MPPIAVLSYRPVTIRAQSGQFPREWALERVRRVVPDWVEVTAMEQPFTDRLEVRLRPARFMRRWALPRSERVAIRLRAEEAVSAVLPGVRILVIWL